MNDKQLLEIYMNGWMDCADQKQKNAPIDELSARAYNIGWYDFIYGDDNSSIDLQTNQEILEHIYKTR